MVYKYILLITALFLSNNISHSLVNKKQFKSLDYIVNNMDQYNRMRKREGYCATKISYVKSVPIHTIDDNKIEGKLLKFNEGYLLFGEDEVIHAHEYLNHLDIRKEFKLEFYDGGTFKKFDTTINKWVLVDENPCKGYKKTKKVFCGQYVKGEGMIYDPDAYVLDRYGSASLFASTQIKTSKGDYYPITENRDRYGQYIKKFSNGTFINEECGALIILGIIADYIINSQSLKVGRAQAFLYDHIKNERDYYLKMLEDGWKVSKARLSYLQIQLRIMALEKFKKVEELTLQEFEELIFEIAREYGLNLLISNSGWDLAFSKLNHFIKAFEDNKIMTMQISNSITYGKLYGAGVGYRYYKKEATFLGMKIIQHIILIEFRDTFSYESNYIDVSVANLNCNTRVMTIL